MPNAVMADGTSLRPEQDGFPTSVGTVEAPPAVVPMLGQVQLAPLGPAGHLGTREQIQAELDEMAAWVRAFCHKQPDQVMRECAAYCARLTELAVLLHRVEATDRQYVRVRTSQVEKWLAELERQFRVASRLVEVQRQDLALLGGQV